MRWAGESHCSFVQWNPYLGCVGALLGEQKRDILPCTSGDDGTTWTDRETTYPCALEDRRQNAARVFATWQGNLGSAKATRQVYFGHDQVV